MCLCQQLAEEARVFLAQVSVHLVLEVLVHDAQFAFELNMDFKVEVADIPLVGLTSKCTMEFLSLLDCKVVIEVEDSLFPMRVRTFRRGGESDPFVTMSELHVEEANETVDVVVATH